MKEDDNDLALVNGHRAILQATDDEQRLAIIEEKAINDAIILQETGELPDLLNPQAMAIRATKEYIEKALMIGQGTIIPQIIGLAIRKIKGNNMQDITAALKALETAVNTQNKSKTPFNAIQFNIGDTGQKPGIQHLKRTD